METLLVADLEYFRPKLETHAQKLHQSLGLSPRPDLAPAILVGGAMSRAVRIQATYEGETPGELVRWLLTQLGNHTKEKWNDAVADYLSMLEGYARIRWPLWDLPPQRLDPSDLVSDAWAKAESQRHTFRGRSEGEYVVWLQTILENHALDEIDRHNNAKKRDRQRERSLEAAVHDSSARLQRGSVP